MPNVILKNIDNYGSGYNWFIFDNQRDKNNPCSVCSEQTEVMLHPAQILLISYQTDLRLEQLQMALTLDGAEIIVYAAWAEAPSIDLYGGGANAR